MRKMSQYLGQKIVYSGYIETWHTKENYTCLLLTNVKVRPYKGNDITLEDHLWLKIPNKDLPAHKGYYRLDVINGVGLVKSYTRKDGSKDVTVEQVPAMGTRKIINFLETIDQKVLNITNKPCCKQSIAKLIGLMDIYRQTILEFQNLTEKEEVMFHIEETYDTITSFCNFRLNQTENNIKLLFPDYGLKPLPTRVVKLQDKFTKKITPSHKLKKGFSN